MAWTPADIPSQAGRTAVVTGANSGLGFHTALELARAGAEVVLAVRDEAKGADAAGKVGREVFGAQVAVERLDVAELASVAAFAERWGERQLDLLIANAGVMGVPVRRTTPDGFELQFGTNYLGHFALAGRLMRAMRRAPAARLVTLSSLYHRPGRIDFDDLQGERYDAWKAYGQSKLAMLMWALEFERRSERGAWGVSAVSAHPGYARTNLQSYGPNLGRRMPLVMRLGMKAVEPFASQPADRGAWPVLRAATDPGARGYWGPGGAGELKGRPEPATIARHARDRAVAARLWAESERLTGVRFPG